MKRRLSFIITIMIMISLISPIAVYAEKPNINIYESESHGVSIAWSEEFQEFYEVITNTLLYTVRFAVRLDDDDLTAVDSCVKTQDGTIISVEKGFFSDTIGISSGMNEFGIYTINNDAEIHPVKIYKVRDKDIYKLPEITVTDTSTGAILYTGKINNTITVDNSVSSVNVQINPNNIDMESRFKHYIEFKEGTSIDVTDGLIITKGNIQLDDEYNDFWYASTYSAWNLGVDRKSGYFIIVKNVTENNDPNSGGGGGGGSSTPTTPPVDTKIDQTTNTVVVSVSETQLASLFKMLQDGQDQVKLAIINIPKVNGLDKYGIELPTSAFTAANSSGVRLETNIGSLTLMDTMLQNVVNANDAQNVKFNMGYVDKTTLDQEAQDTIGNHPIISLNMELDGTVSEWSNPDSPVIVSVPYTPTAEELANPELIVVYYIDGQGNLNPVPNATYDATNKCMVFTTTHFSDYAIGYNKKTFTDISDENVKHAVEILAAKGVVNGKVGSNFAPKDVVTRAEFITMLSRAFEFNTAFDNSFTDVSSDKYYYNAVGMAKEMGVTNGINDTQFNPNGILNKKQIEIIVNNLVKAKGLTIDEATQMSLLSGIDDSGGITRDEIGVLIYNLM